MKKVVLLATALAMVSGSASLRIWRVKAVKARRWLAFDPWDIAFGGAIMSDYVFRGITQSNHKPSVAAYFEPRYNVNKDVQLYVGTSAESISFANRAAAEVDVYVGIRPTFGPFAFDFGFWDYLYPGGQCLRRRGSGVPSSRRATSDRSDWSPAAVNGNVTKKNASFYEGYGKVNYTFNDQFALGVNEYYSPNFLNLGAWGNYASVTGKWIAPSTMFGTSRRRHLRLGRVRPSVARHLGCLLRHPGRARTVPARVFLSRLQHLEHRRRLHLQGVHARPALLRHQPVQG